MDFDRRFDRQGVHCRIVVATRPTAAPAAELAAAALNLHESAVAARELTSTDGRDRKEEVLQWVLLAAQDLHAAIRRSITDPCSAPG